jgi:hypothetical protein
MSLVKANARKRISKEGHGFGRAVRVRCALRLQSLRENWETVRHVVGAPAFMRGKERLSAPGKSLDFDHAFSAGNAGGFS